MIELSNLQRRFGDLLAVRDLSLRVQAGEIFAFLGMNGAGKTTTIRMMTGILAPTSGSIRLGGFDIQRSPIEAKSLIGYIPDRPHMYGRLTAREFLYFVSDLFRMESRKSEEMIDSLLDHYGLREWENELIEEFSHGMKQRLATCAALVHSPRILILDEPMVGLDPCGARLLKQSLRSYASQGLAVFMSTHSLNVAEEIADRIGIIHKGGMIAAGRLEEIRRQSGNQKETLEEIFLALTMEDEQMPEIQRTLEG